MDPYPDLEVITVFDDWTNRISGYYTIMQNCDDFYLNRETIKGEMCTRESRYK